MSRGFKIGVLAAAVMAVAPAAQAFEAGDFVVRGGAVHVAPDDSSESITIGGTGLLDSGNAGSYNISNTRATVDSNTQLGLRATYMFSDSLGLGLLAATPFKHDINAEGDGSDLGKVGETKHLPPTITLQYYPMSSSSKIQPYAGVGVNYTVFFEEKTTGFLNTALQNEYGATNATSELDLDDSVGLAVEIGMDYMLSDNFGLNAAMWWADINTDAEVTANLDGTTVKTDTFEVEIDPMVYMIGMTYKF